MSDKTRASKIKTLQFFLFIAMVFIFIAIFNTITEPNNKGQIFGSILMGLSLMIGVGGALVTQDKAKVLKVITFIIGLFIVIAMEWIFRFSNIPTLVGTFVGGFFVAVKGLVGN